VLDFSFEKASIKAIKKELYDNSDLRHYAICRYYVSGSVAGVGFVDLFDDSVSGDATNTFRDILVKGIFSEGGGLTKQFVPGGYVENSDAVFYTEYISGFIFDECDEIWCKHTFNVNPPTSGNCGDVKYNPADNYTSGTIDGGEGYIVRKIENTPFNLDTIVYLDLKEK